MDKDMTGNNVVPVAFSPPIVFLAFKISLLTYPIKVLLNIFIIGVMAS